MAEINSRVQVELDSNQMQTLESLVTRMEKAAKGRKSIRSHIFDFCFGRMMLILAFSGYLFLQNGLPDFSKVQKEVLKFDQTSGILTISNRGVLENYIFKNNKMTQNGKEVTDDFVQKVGYAILLDAEFPIQEGFW